MRGEVAGIFPEGAHELDHRSEWLATAERTSGCLRERTRLEHQGGERARVLSGGVERGDTTEAGAEGDDLSDIDPPEGCRQRFAHEMLGVPRVGTVLDEPVIGVDHQRSDAHGAVDVVEHRPKRRVVEVFGSIVDDHQGDRLTVVAGGQVELAVTGLLEHLRDHRQPGHLPRSDIR